MTEKCDLCGKFTKYELLCDFMGEYDEEWLQCWDCSSESDREYFNKNLIEVKKKNLIEFIKNKRLEYHKAHEHGNKNKCLEVLLDIANYERKDKLEI